MKQVFIILMLSISVSSIYGQSTNTQFMLENGKLLQGKYTLYKPTILLSPIYKDTTEAFNKNPEELMISILSSNSKEWEKYNSLSFDDEDKYESFDNKTLNYELISRFDFQLDTLQMAFIKYKLINTAKKKEIIGITIMQKNRNRWKTTSTVITTKLSTFFLVFKDEVSYRILSDKPSNEIERKFLYNVKVKNNFSIEKLLSQSFDYDEKNYFINSLNW